MSDLLQDVNLLRYYHTSDDMLRDKDFEKDRLIYRFQATATGLIVFPLFAQAWQLGLTGKADQLGLYKKVRVFKTSTLVLGLGIGLYEFSQLKKKLKYIDRVYPEPTQLQRQLEIEAQQYKENKVVVKSVQERMQLLQNPQARTKYSQFYQLPPQRHKDEYTDFNAPSHAEHWN